jgi:predicted enzyme related to lactoylglutathione lyase
MNLRFDHLGLLTDSREKNQDIADFFTGVLGLEVSGNAGEGYAEVKAGAMTIALHTGAMIDDFGTHGGTLLQFTSDDVRADIEDIRGRGGKIALEPTEADWGTIAYRRRPARRTGRALHLALVSSAARLSSAARSRRKSGPVRSRLRAPSPTSRSTSLPKPLWGGVCLRPGSATARFGRAGLPKPVWGGGRSGRPCEAGLIARISGAGHWRTAKPSQLACRGRATLRRVGCGQL